MEFTPFGIQTRSDLFFGSSKTTAVQVHNENLSNRKLQIKNSALCSRNLPTKTSVVKTFGVNENLQAKIINVLQKEELIQPLVKPRKALGDISNRNSGTAGFTHKQNSLKDDFTGNLSKKVKLNTAVHIDQPTLSSLASSLHHNPPPLSLVPQPAIITSTEATNQQLADKGVEEPEHPAGRLWDSDRAWAERLAAAEEDNFFQFEVDSFTEDSNDSFESSLLNTTKLTEEEEKNFRSGQIEDELSLDHEFSCYDSSEHNDLPLAAINNFTSDIDWILGNSDEEV